MLLLAGMRTCKHLWCTSMNREDVGLFFAGELITKANGDTSDRVGRPIDDGQIGVIDPSNRMIGLHMYEGLFKVTNLCYIIRVHACLLTGHRLKLLHACWQACS